MSSFVLLALWGCGPDPLVERGPEPSVAPAPPVLRRLTDAQYRNAIRDLFGPGLVLPSQLEPDVAIGGLLALGASETTVSPYGVEQYEAAATTIAEQVLADPAFVPCTPAGTRDDGCARQVLEPLGRRVWRRPLEPGELDALVGLSGVAAETLGGFHDGLQYGLTALLQSPWFLYRVELGDGSGAYTDFEMASRLAFFLWDTVPDDELLDAAEAGELTSTGGLEAQVDRMLADPRAREGVRSFFEDLWGLHELDRTAKDPSVFNAYSPDLKESAREETLRAIDDLVFERDASYRDVFDTPVTFLDRRLAALYGVPAPAAEGFARAILPPQGGRVGLLGNASILMMEAHPVSTSVTKRGVFVRQTVLCQEIPPPPADVDTSIPEPSEDAPTMRERVARHLEEDSCAACHRQTDPIGLGLETFDGIGAARTHENGARIDTSGDLDGEPYRTAAELGGLLARHPTVARCLVQKLSAYGTGSPADRDDPSVLWHTEGFDLEGDRVRWLLRDLVTSQSFRTVGEVE